MPPSFSITVEEHVSFPSLRGGDKFHDEMQKMIPGVKQALEDCSEGRIADLDEGHVSFQFLSHVPGTSNHHPGGCRSANDEMAEAIKKYPTRLGGLADLPMVHPEEAAAELERAVNELGFFGALINNHLSDMTHYDDERFWPVFEMAERLDVPIYIHPSPAPGNVIQQRFGGNYSPLAAQALSSFSWGWHENVGLHILKLYAAGLFDRFPSLKIIVGHMGELLPIMLDRVQSANVLREKNKLRGFGEVWDKNIWVTSSGVFSVRTLEMLLKVTRKDRVMYSVDTPFSKNAEGWRYLEELAESSSLSREELDMFAYGNARKLFKLDFELKKFA
ncbi:amidohydrolase 2 [Hypoxylon fragiforme]|uniref:amidohydrolase 2 n=1 Tax=Hypoxylon fragiforme TaxID=63214 RepID=UPI0020C7143D|nr:amidohydrolase 2 [Hypoxylon fragiforme]KAI2611343.1 amidohydrolase 2 [Hypoxylon fragiforme]